jgi:uncharacterized protein YkwD
MPARSRRLLAGLFLATALFVAAAPADLAQAAPSTDQKSVQRLVNQTRGNNRLGALTFNDDFSNKATLWARELVRCQCLKHRAGPYGAAPGWCAAAENVGRGYSFAQIHNAFLNSPPHRANILTGRFNIIGVGVATDRNGEIFVVQAFQDRSC